jgi:hypothetical protein
LGDNYNQFAVDLIEKADKLNIAHNSNMNTKCVGSIWMLIKALGLDISAQKVDSICNVRKNTFFRFCESIQNYKSNFAEIYQKYNLDFSKFQSVENKKRHKSKKT